MFIRLAGVNKRAGSADGQDPGDPGKTISVPAKGVTMISPGGTAGRVFVSISGHGSIECDGTVDGIEASAVAVLSKPVLNHGFGGVAKRRK